MVKWLRNLCILSEGHPKRVEQDSQRTNHHAPSPSNKKKTDRTLHASSESNIDTPENPNDISISDAETQSGDEHEPSDNLNDDVHVMLNLVMIIMWR